MQYHSPSTVIPIFIHPCSVQLSASEATSCESRKGSFPSTSPRDLPISSSPFSPLARSPLHSKKREKCVLKELHLHLHLRLRLHLRCCCLLAFRCRFLALLTFWGQKAVRAILRIADPGGSVDILLAALTSSFLVADWIRTYC